MKKFYMVLSLLASCFTQLLLAQQMPIDYSDSQENFSGFNGTTFSIDVDPVDSGNNVGRIVNTGGIWEGAYLNLTRSIDLDFQKTISLSFYCYNSNAHSIVLKLENGTNANVEVVQNISASGWTHNITFDFANAVYSGGSTPVSASGIYNTITVFIDGGSTISGNYLIDNIDDGSTPITPPSDPVYNQLVWSDEFDGSGAINSTNWFHQTQLPTGGSWYNGEQQHYTNRIDNSYVSGGFLNIVAKKESFTDQSVTKQYTSARLNSKYVFTYGKVEVRAKLPTGVGTWPAIWMLGKNISETGAYWETQGFGTTSWPACGEIDIMEHWGSNQNYVQSAMHTPSSFGGTVNKGGQTISTASTAFHVYVLEWYPDKMIFSVDGSVHYTYQPSVRNANTWPFDTEQYLLLNIAIQSSIAASFTQSAMVIDYVRIYQENPLNIKENLVNRIKLYPNPVTSKINIATSLPIDKLELYDITGKRILSSIGKLKHIDVSALNSGIYLLKIYSGEKQVNKKIVIH